MFLGLPDPDPPQNVMDPEHFLKVNVLLFLCSCQGVRRLRMSLENTGMLATIATTLLPCPGIRSTVPVICKIAA
jgi:hypothetical protein